jgi:uncharacterized protein with HEPN domain
MSERPNNIIIQDMIESIENILEFTKDLDFSTYIMDRKTKHAVERNLEILGEAANHLNENFYVNHPEIQWHRVISLRNRLIHGYFDTNDEIIWEVINNYLIPLKDILQKISLNF